MKILITGASSGIGKEISKKALALGYEVVAIARNFDKCEIDDLHFKKYSLDLSDIKNLPKKLKEIASKETNIETLILNAGRGYFGYLEQLSYEEMISLINLNFLSAAFVTKAFLPPMKKNQKGTVIFIGSNAALEGKTQGSIYCASKFALKGFSQAIRKECAKSGVRVSLINPGFVKTSFFDSLHFSHSEDEENYCLPQEVAEVVINQIRARKALVFDEINLSSLKSQIAQKKESESHLNNLKIIS